MSDLNKLKELKALAGKATPGPWASASDWERAAVYSTSKDAYPKGKRVVCSGNQNNKGRYIAESWSGSDWSDAAFIAAANPDTVIALIDRLEAAEAELARRDAAAGEPVKAVAKHYVGCKYPLVKINGLEFIVAGSREDAEEVSEELSKLYTAAQPSALPPEMFMSDAVKANVTTDFMDGANWMREQVKALGCKAIKLPKVNHPAQFDYADRMTEALKSQGFTVEGE